MAARRPGRTCRLDLAAGADRFGGGISKELLNPDLIGEPELLLVTIEPYSSSGPKSYTHQGEEAGTVLMGELELFLDSKRHVLGPGDSFAFRSDRPHRFGNPGPRRTKLIWCLTPPLYQGRSTSRSVLGKARADPRPRRRSEIERARMMLDK